MSVIAESDDELDRDYDMLDSDLDEPAASTAPSSPPLNSSSSKLPRCRRKIHKCIFDDCDKAFDRKARLEDHIRSHNNERNFECPYSPCTKTFLRDSHLKHHIKNQHTEIRDHKCAWEGCDASFTTGTRLRRHIATHEAKEQFRCRGYAGCDQTFRKQDTLDRHILTVHQGIKPFPCKELDPVTGDPCSKAYDTAENLRTHMRSRHDGSRFSCEECKALNATIVANPEGEDNPPLRDNQFATYALFQEHNAKFHPPTCPFCPTSFVTTKELTRHLELQHGVLKENKKHNDATGSAALTCSFPGCGKKFSKKGNLAVHVKTVHENKRDFVCGQTRLPIPSDFVGPPLKDTVHGCGRGFTSKASLEEHVRTAHLDLPSKRMIREKKRKAEDDADHGEAIERKQPKERKPRSDKGISRGSAMTELTGPARALTPAVQEGPFPFGFGDDPVPSTDSNPSAASFRAENTPSNLVPCAPPNKKTFLSASMTMLGDHIYSEGVAYHWPSGEYPTQLSHDLARTTVNDPFDDVNFFGQFEQEQEAHDGSGSFYPAL